MKRPNPSTSIICGLLFILFSACDSTEFPAPRPFPLVETLEVSEISENGATFSMKLLDFGEEEILDYGFVWGIDFLPSIEKNDTVHINSMQAQQHSVSIDNGLVDNIIYRVRSYIRGATKITYGNVVEFTSMGSKKNPWTFLQATDNILKTQDIVSINSDAYLWERRSRSFQTYDPFSPQREDRALFPFVPSTGVDFQAFEVSGEFNVFVTFSQNLFRYEKSSNSWSRLEPRIPFFSFADLALVALSLDNKVYLVSLEFPYVYDPALQEWTAIPAPPLLDIFNGFVLGNHLYVVGKSRVNENCMRYSPSSNSWEAVAPFPDIDDPDMFVFKLGEKAYVGIKEATIPTRVEESNKGRIWSYDPAANNWEFISSLPAADIITEYTEAFTYQDKGYLAFPGNRPSVKEMLYFEFDPANIQP